MHKKIFLISFLSIFLFISCNKKSSPKTELKYWNDTPVTKKIKTYLKDISDEKSKNFIPKSERIAVFDNDGTLWGEYPMYVQFIALLDFYKDIIVGKYNRSNALVDEVVEQFPNVKDKGKLYQALLDMQAGVTNDEYMEYMAKWLATKKHPKLKKKYTQLVYAPSVELMRTLEAFDFKVFIVTGGGTHFVRTLNNIVYDLPSYQIIGTRFGKKFSENGKVEFQNQAKLAFLNDKENKPVGILEHIGKVPVFVLGNSDGDFAMGKYTSLNSKFKSFVGIIHHDDSAREFAYDRDSHVGKLDKVLSEGDKYFVNLISMKKDFKQIYFSESDKVHHE